MMAQLQSKGSIRGSCSLAIAIPVQRHVGHITCQIKNRALNLRLVIVSIYNFNEKIVGSSKVYLDCNFIRIRLMADDGFLLIPFISGETNNPFRLSFKFYMILLACQTIEVMTIFPKKASLLSIFQSNENLHHVFMNQLFPYMHMSLVH